MKDVWTTIDDRQRAYLRACYTIDYDRTRRSRAARTRGSLIANSDEADWLLYGPTLPASPLLHRLRLLKLVDSTTLPTFRSLELHELLHCRFERASHAVLLYVQLTPQGRYVTRIGLGLPAAPLNL